jgi:hypothetical protein
MLQMQLLSNAMLQAKRTKQCHIANEAAHKCHIANETAQQCHVSGYRFTIKSFSPPFFLAVVFCSSNPLSESNHLLRLFY